MPLIDATYFDGPLLIVGLNTEPVELAVNNAITTHEVNGLLKMFGSSLYAAFVAGTGSGFSSGFSSGFGGTVETRWLWLINGHTYTINGISYIWPGLVNASKQSPIANYVYYEYMDESYPVKSSVGQFIQKGPNAEYVSPARDMKKAWDKMVVWTRVLGYVLAYYRVNDALLYPEFNYWEVDNDVYEFIPPF